MGGRLNNRSSRTVRAFWSAIRPTGSGSEQTTISSRFTAPWGSSHDSKLLAGSCGCSAVMPLSPVRCGSRHAVASPSVMVESTAAGCTTPSADSIAPQERTDRSTQTLQCLGQEGCLEDLSPNSQAEACKNKVGRGQSQKSLDQRERPLLLDPQHQGHLSSQQCQQH